MSPSLSGAFEALLMVLDVASLVAVERGGSEDGSTGADGGMGSEVHVEGG